MLRPERAVSMRFLFWNVGRRQRVELLGAMVDAFDVDVVALAESNADPAEVLERLSAIPSSRYGQPANVNPRLQLYSRLPASQFREVYGDETGRMSIRAAQFEFGELLLVIAHLPSKRNWDAQDQAAEASIVADRLRQFEDERGHRRSVLAGDLNMHPFEPGIVQANGLHAMMTRASVADRSRTVQAREYPYFYNPMWGFLGDCTPGPAGTMYYRHSGHVTYDWNLFDQVLIRPDVLPYFAGNVEIVTAVNGLSLLNDRGRPNPDVASDHLPIAFDLELPLE